MSNSAMQVRSPDNLGDAIERYSSQELAKVIGGYREAWGDLGKVVQDLDAVGFISDGSAHPWAPMVMERLHHHLQHPHHHEMVSRLGHAGHTIHRLMSYLHHIMARHVSLEREKRLWHAKSNVVQTMYWQNVASNTNSTTATVKAPYSGVNYMVLDILMDTVLTPPGMWTNISFASINFAQSGSQIVYTPPGTGVQGGPAAGGHGFEVFLHDKTAPEGARGWNPWTGWILSSDAVSTWQWMNLDPVNPRSLTTSILMRSSPCEMSQWEGNVQQMMPGQQAPTSIPWAGYPAFAHAGIGQHALDMMYAGVLGLSPALRGHPTQWGISPGAFQGQQMSHPGNFGSVGPGMGVHPTGHAGPTGGSMHSMGYGHLT
jgi:hypothetical protein